MKDKVSPDYKCCSELSKWLSPRFFKALSDPNRVSILAYLAESGEEQTCSQVALHFPVDLSVVCRHLATLRDAGILQSKRRGKEVFYRVRTDSLVDLLRNLADSFQACCPGEIPMVEEETL